MSLAAQKIRLVMMLRQSGITDTAVLAAIERIPREAFVPPTFVDQAYENRTLPIGRGQTLSQPEVVALMTQALELKSRPTLIRGTISQSDGRLASSPASAYAMPPHSSVGGASGSRP